MSAQAHWNAAYAQGDERRSWTEPTPACSLDAISAVTSPAAAVIDVGGGSSRLAGALLGEGYRDVTVLDVSTAALGLAQRRLGGDAERVCWVVADVLEWWPSRRYDVWHDRAVLHFFTEPHDRARYGEVLRAALAPAGHAVIACFAPHGPDHCSGLPVRRSSADELLGLLGDQFTAVSAQTRLHRTPAGTEQPFVWLVAQRSHGSA